MGIFDTLTEVVEFQSIERDPIKRRLAKVADLNDLRRVARRRLPPGVFDYIDGGAESESALARNASRYGDYTFRPRVLRDVKEVDPATSLLGRPLAFPLVAAPTGFTRIAHPQGELAVARAAERAGIPYGLSTLGTRSIEEVAAVSGGRHWFQVYVWRDRGLVRDMIERAAEARFEALCITVDTARLGRRERDVRRGYTLPPKIGLDTIIDGLLRPAWTLDFLRNEPIVFSNVAVSQARTDHATNATNATNAIDGTGAITLADYINTQFDPSLSWSDVEWMREQWDGPIVLKGIQSVDDARIAADMGIEAVCLSNHGGRQLDHAPAPVDLVAPVADAIGGRSEILCDGGIRRGSDIAKALALGATACMAGRPYLYGLGAAGEAGVDLAFEFLRDGLELTMALVGATTVADLNAELIDPQSRS